MANLATYALSTAAVTTRSSEVTAADWSGGMNRGGANACGIGIASDLIDPSTNDWTTLDQHGNARSPQLTQHIGITGLGAGSDSPLTGHGVMVINC